jgi:hypothetical protein
VSLRIENRKLRASNTTLKEEVKDASLALEMDLALLNSIQGIASKILMSTTADRFNTHCHKWTKRSQICQCNL